MAANELDAIKMAPSYRKVLVEQLHVTTWRDLVLTERSMIIDAIKTAKVARRPSLEQVAAWQDDARRHLGERPEQKARPEPDPWDQKASFIVCFQERRRPDLGWERRVEVTQAEVEPEPSPASHLGWDCHWVCSWMRDVLALDQEESQTNETTSALAVAEPAVRRRTSRDASPRMQLTFGTSELVDRNGRRNLVGDPKSAETPLRCSAPAHLGIEVQEAASADVHLTVRVRTSGQRDVWTLHDAPIVGRGATQVDLAPLPAGDHHLTVVAWTTSESIDSAWIKLGVLHVDPAPGGR